jgi:hypothetical protein
MACGLRISITTLDGELLSTSEVHFEDFDDDPRAAVSQARDVAGSSAEDEARALQIRRGIPPSEIL